MELSDLESVRRRPQMYIGDLRTWGLRALLYEVLGNALDEHLAGRATRIDIVLQEGGGAVVEDDGRGMPWHEVGGMSVVERALTSFHDSPTLDGHKPHAHVGLRGLGIFVVNALSLLVEVDSWREGRHFSQRYERGVPQTAVVEEGLGDRRGTRIRYVPDPVFFADAELAFERVRERLEEISIVNAGLRIDLLDERKRRAQFAPHAGLVTAVGGGPEAISLNGAHEDVSVDVALHWRLDRDEPARIVAFANGEVMRGGGTHQRGLILGIANALLPHLPSPRRHAATARNALLRGLEACVHVTLHSPKFETPTRASLESPEAKRAVERVVRTGLTKQFAGRPELRDDLLERVEAALTRAR